MKSCLVCDDHALVREALAGMVAMAWPAAEVWQAGDFPAAWAAARAMPSIIIADLMMPGAGPLDGIAGLMAAAPGTPLLVVTGTEDDALLLDLIDRGVAGFAPKTANGAIIEAALRLILAGGRYLPARMAELASARTASDKGRAGIAAGSASTGVRLSPRQLDVLRLMASGQSNKEIARSLALAPSTVKTHSQQIMQGLGAANRTEAASLARKLNLL